MQPIFAEDENGRIVSVDPTWTMEEVLAQKGVFYLRDLLGVLRLKKQLVWVVYRKERGDGPEPWNTIGIKRLFNQFHVRMTVFAPYYREHLMPRHRQIEPSWDGNHLLAQKGSFLMTEVCKLIPFSANQLRYQCRKCPKSREQMGIWKANNDLYYVEMEQFSVWLKSMIASFNATLSRPKQPKPAPKRQTRRGRSTHP